MAEAFSGGASHGYLTFRSNAQAVAACDVVSVALGTVAPPPGQLPGQRSTVSTVMSYAASRYIHGTTPWQRDGRRCCQPRRPPRAQIGPLSRWRTSRAS